MKVEFIVLIYNSIQRIFQNLYTTDDLILIKYKYDNISSNVMIF